MTTSQLKRVKTGVSFPLTCITAQADQNHELQLQCGQTILDIEKANKDVEQSRDYFEFEKKKEEARMTNFQRAGEPGKIGKRNTPIELVKQDTEKPRTGKAAQRRRET